MKKVLIIGGSGFIGSYLISKYNNSQVINLDKNQSPFHNDITKIGDIRDLTTVKDVFKNIHTVILLAAEHKDNVKPTSLYYDVNVIGTQNVLKFMDNNNIDNLVFTSSVAVYGLNKKNPDESHKLEPFGDYGKSKYKAELLINEWYKTNPNKKSVTIIRPTVVFGERNRGNVYNLLKIIYERKFIMVGTGKNKKSMAYVKNISAFIKQIETEKKIGYHIYNYIDKPDITMNKLVELISMKFNFYNYNIKIPYFFAIFFTRIIDFFAFILNTKFPVSSVRIKKFCAVTTFNSEKMQKIFKPPYKLEQGLKNTLDFEFTNEKHNDGIKFFSE
ncbi:MAG: UDP-N-acetylglucosamine 4-epimerase [Flavobacteriaceae bacterium]|nr:UDP-N-acetylglucosamine 4-epimerase [Flavobacteriaceae bacterium]|tara:strand:+ start:29961 stop:30950 length:990 start_codon:yes stop_codon:yes gene_type:complete